MTDRAIVYELEILPPGAHLVRGWAAAGDYPDPAEAEATLRELLATGTTFQSARLRVYGPGRSTARTKCSWVLYGRTLKRIEWAGWGRPARQEVFHV